MIGASIDSNQFKLTEYLINEGLDLNGVGPLSHVSPPLHFAISRGHFDIAHLLIDRGADIHLKSFNGETPLFSATRSGSLKFAETLIKNGADITISNKRGSNLLHVACQCMSWRAEDKTAMVAAFLERGADSLSLDEAGNTPDVYLRKSETESLALIEKAQMLKKTASPVSTAHPRRRSL